MTIVEAQGSPPSESAQRPPRKRRVGKPAGIAAAVAAAASVVIAATGLVGGGSDGPTKQAGGSIADGSSSVSGTGNLSGNGQVEVNGNFCSGEGSCAEPPRVAAGDDRAAADAIRGTVRPAAPGPWPFVVLFDEGEGLKIRDSAERAGSQVGLAIGRSTVWVDCVTTSSFNPEPGGPAGPRWYKVHWPNATPSEQVRSSGPGDPANAWAYARYLVPNGTDGSVPACPA
jgi:hypothetical protein